ncbi:MAG TPA: hypothetical protein VG942_01120 [Hyphomonadaceae bacterium]|nr:hypothetical protein [Hyphomonadaceae bacterium]
MKRIAVAAFAILAAGCASSPSAPAKPAKPLTPAEMLVGHWTCTTDASGMAMKIDMNYGASGTGTFQMSVSGGQGPVTIEAAGSGEQTWALSENDTKLTSTITSVKITSAKLNGSDIDPSMAQTMLEPQLKGQSSTASVSITPAKMVQTTPEATSTCTR